MEYLKVACYFTLTVACIIYIFRTTEDDKNDHDFILLSEIKEMQADIWQLRNDYIKIQLKE